MRVFLVDDEFLQRALVKKSRRRRRSIKENFGRKAGYFNYGY